MKKAAPHANEEQLAIDNIISFVAEGLKYKYTHCPSCKKKLFEYSQVGTIGMIEDHTFYLLCSKCKDNLNELHTRRNNNRVMKDYDKYAFLCQADMTIIGWYLLKRSAVIVMDEVVHHA